MELQTIINIYPAKSGDCFLITLRGVSEKQKHLLIDCGFGDTVNNYLKADLIKISNAGEGIEKLILTHIDADHIQGAIKLLKDNNSKKFVEIKEIWHNTFRHLFEKNATNLDKKSEKLLKQLIQRGYPKGENKQSDQKISAEQGTAVGALILQGNYPWNNDFDGHAVCIENKRKIRLDTDSNIYILSPDKQKLEKLKDLWKDELKKYGINYNYDDSQLYDDAFEMLLTWEEAKPSIVPKQISSTRDEPIKELIKRPFDKDTTGTNGSSIAFVLQIQNKRLLFLADAHPELIVKSLKSYQHDGPIVFDIIKVSHHGSFSNINRELLNKIDSERYLFSTSGGRHNHPDKETIAHIVSRKAEFHRKLYFNYITDSSKYFDREDWMKEYNYSIHYLSKTSYMLIL